MKAKKANARRLNILGSVDWLSDQEVLTATLKRWRRKLGYCSVFAAVPAILASYVQAARSDETKEPETSVPGRGARLLERLNLGSGNRALLKRQSKFRLPHQKGGADLLTPLAGTDDCPGRPIPGGNYTAAAPYVDSGNTTGANDTVTSLPSFYYYYYFSYDAHGPDHVYSFTLTGRGPNPQIDVSTTSGTYRPLIYVLKGGPAGACPAGTGNFGNSEVVLNDSRWTTGSTATLDHWQMEYLPLNVPLHLFVDSRFNDAGGAGPYTIRMQDVTIAPAQAQNRKEAGVFRQNTAALFLKNANTSGVADMAFNFGNPGDYPVAGDWNGDGIDTVGSYRDGVFYLSNSLTTGPAQLVIGFGNPGDQPIVGDWNGDGIVTLGVFRPSNGTVYLRNSNSTGFADVAFVFGNPGDLPVAGDWDGDGVATVGIYRAGIFYLRNANTTGFADLVFAFGSPGDFPLVGDWNGQP